MSHKSWKQKGKLLSLVEMGSEKITVAEAYYIGTDEFQKKAIEALKDDLKDPLDNTRFSEGYYEGIQKAIMIVKNLKA